jgi:hypothetical protein
MTPNRHVKPLSDLSGWDRLPKKHEPLPGQQCLFDLQTLMPIVQAPGADKAQPNDQRDLFESGRDLPGASERDQRIIWDVH